MIVVYFSILYVRMLVNYRLNELLDKVSYCNMFAICVDKKYIGNKFQTFHMNLHLFLLNVKSW